MWGVVFLTSPAHVMLLWVFESNGVAVRGRIEGATGVGCCGNVEVCIARDGAEVCPEWV